MLEVLPRWRALAVCMALCVAMSCAKTNEPQPSRETNWLMRCDSDTQCVDSQCVCGICTRACAGDDACGGSGVVCQAADTVLVRSACDSASAATGLCAPSCQAEDECALGQACVQRACLPATALDAGLLQLDASP